LGDFNAKVGEKAFSKEQSQEIYNDNGVLE
jgi:hypothetical protein